MSQTTEEFELTPSVKAYLTDPAVRAGVDALLQLDAKALPVELEWDEIGDYYAARAAAELTRNEWALMLYGLWHHVWLPVVDRSWLRCSPQEALDDGLDIAPANCWSEKAFEAYFRRGGSFLYLGVHVTRVKTVIAFALEDADNVLIDQSFGDFTWSDSGEWGNWLIAEISGTPASDDFSLDSLRAIARSAMEHVASTEDMPRSADLSNP